MGQASGKVQVTRQDRCILDLKLQRDKLKQYQKRIEVVLAREREIAKEALAAGNRTRALTALRQRKHQESLLTQTDSQLEMLQKLVSSIEFSLVEKDIVFGLQQGNSVLKEIHKEMNLDKVEQLMSDTAEGIAYQNARPRVASLEESVADGFRTQEIDAMLSNTMSAAEEEEVLEELAALQAAQLPQLPDVPLGELPQRVEEPTVVEERPQGVATPRQALAA